MTIFDELNNQNSLKVAREIVKLGDIGELADKVVRCSVFPNCDITGASQAFEALKRTKEKLLNLS